MPDENKKDDKEITEGQRTTYAYIRIIAGAYLIFTAYDMLRDSSFGAAADAPKALVPMAVIFAIFGILFIIFSIIRIFKLRK